MINKGIKIIFLDIDGVLNCKTTTDKIDGYTGIEDEKVNYLKDIVEKTKAKIVLISSWKEHWKKEPYKSLQDNMATYLDNKLAKYDLKISDKTRDYESNNRAVGIIRYLKLLRRYGIRVNNYVIIDDYPFDYLKTKTTKNLVKTSYHRGGLELRHVKKAIEILNNKERSGAIC